MPLFIILEKHEGIISSHGVYTLRKIYNEKHGCSFGHVGGYTSYIGIIRCHYIYIYIRIPFKQPV